MNPEIQTMLRQASQLFRDGRVPEGIEAYQRLLARCPDLPNSWFNLAMLQRSARRPDEALAAYQRALDLGIDQPEEVHLQRGVIYADDLGNGDAARVELLAALTIDPDYRPALLNLGNLDEDEGNRSGARAAYARVLARDPHDPLALARFTGLAEIEGANDALLQRVRAAIAWPGAEPVDRADLGFALGTVLDRIGAYDAAFDAYVDANRASCSIAAAAGYRYDRQRQERLVDRLIATFPIGQADEDVAVPRPSPIFICGMFRSGSTLTEQILARHAMVSAGGELDALPALVATGLAPYPEAAATVSPERLATLRDAYLAQTAGRHSAGTVLTDKRPDNFLHIGIIKALFPNARIVHTSRNVRDNALSVYCLHAAPALSYATDLGDIAHYQVQERRLMAYWRTIWPDDIFDLDYDRLVAAPRETATELLNFCGLPWDDGVLDHRRGQGSVRTASNWQIRQPLYRSSSGRSRNYRRHLDNHPELV